MEPLALTIPAQKPVRLAVIPIAGACPGMWRYTIISYTIISIIKLSDNDSIVLLLLILKAGDQARRPVALPDPARGYKVIC